MADKSRTPHPPADEIADYFSGRVAPPRASTIEEHFALCDACADGGRRIYSVKSAWNGWTARSHAAARREAVLAGALAHVSASGEFAHWRGRLTMWVERWACKAEGAVRVIIEAPAQEGEAARDMGNCPASRLITRGVESLVRGNALWQFALPAPLFRSEGPDTRVVALPPGGPPARIEVVGHSALEVHVDMPDDPVGAPLALLADTQGEKTPRLEQLCGRDGHRGLFALFDKILPGKYVVALEPRPGSD